MNYYTINSDGARRSSANAGGLYQGEGNPTLAAEEAKTWTAGFVLSLPFENPLLVRGESDGGLLPDQAQQGDQPDLRRHHHEPLLQSGAQPRLVGDSIWCRAMERDQDLGTLAVTNALYSNESTFDTRGYDVQFDWRGNLSDMGTSIPGALALNIQATILDRFLERTGCEHGGPRLEELRGSEPHGRRGRWRWFIRVQGVHHAGVQQSHVGRVVAPSVLSRRSSAADELTSPGAAGMGLIAATPKYQLFDLSATYAHAGHDQDRGWRRQSVGRDPPIQQRNLAAGQRV